MNPCLTFGGKQDSADFELLQEAGSSLFDVFWASFVSELLGVFIIYNTICSDLFGVGFDKGEEGGEPEAALAGLLLLGGLRVLRLLTVAYEPAEVGVAPHGGGADVQEACHIFQ